MTALFDIQSPIIAPVLGAAVDARVVGSRHAVTSGAAAMSRRSLKPARGGVNAGDDSALVTRCACG